MQKPFKELFEGTKEATTTLFEPLEVGEYEARINQVSYDGDKNRLSVEYDLETYLVDRTKKVEGRKAWGSYKLDNEQSISFLKKDLKKLNIEPTQTDSPFTFADELHQKLDGKRVKLFINQRTHNDKVYNGVYINELLGLRNFADGIGDAPKVDTTENIPF